jgi:peptidoglycan/xylan/chitin deacetylase (PgdA/CDA1 family)
MGKAMTVFNFTVDLEPWPLNPSAQSSKKLSQQAVENSWVGARNISILLGEKNVRATFFVTAMMAGNDRAALKEIAGAGHEIGSHGFLHIPLTGASQSILRQEIQMSAETLHSLSGCKVRGFRAPYCLIDAETFSYLEEERYQYDSSILPTWIPGRYRRFSYPTFPYRPSRVDLGVRGGSSIIEIPLSVYPYVRLPIGWWWFRNLGANWTLRGARWLLKKRTPVVFNIHSWEAAGPPLAAGLPRHLTRRCGSKVLSMLRFLIEQLLKDNIEFVTSDELAAVQLDPSSF